MIDKYWEERPPSPKRDRGASAARSSSRPVPGPAIYARHARAHPPPQGPRPGPSRHRCRPPLPPARAEPRPPRLVPSGLDNRPPHPCQEFREPPCPPPLSPPEGNNNANDQRSVDATIDPSPEDNRPRATQSTSLSSPPPTMGEGGEGCRTQHPVASGIMQLLGQVPPHSHPLSSSSSAGDRRGGSGGGGG
jgi:hypothetical protein